MPCSVLQPFEQVDDAGLDADVERRHRLVEHDETRLEGQRPGDADALALAAGELVRVAVAVLGGEADSRAAVGDPLRRAFLAGASVDVERLADDVVHRHLRVQRGVRVLEHDLHVLPQRPQPCAGQA